MKGITISKVALMLGGISWIIFLSNYIFLTLFHGDNTRVTVSYAVYIILLILGLLSILFSGTGGILTIVASCKKKQSVRMLIINLAINFSHVIVYFITIYKLIKVGIGV